MGIILGTMFGTTFGTICGIIFGIILGTIVGTVVGTIVGIIVDTYISLQRAWLYSEWRLLLPMNSPIVLLNLFRPPYLDVYVSFLRGGRNPPGPIQGKKKSNLPFTHCIGMPSRDI